MSMWCPPGAVPLASRTRMTTLTTRISATVTPSMTSSSRVPPRTGEMANAQTPARAMPPIRKPDQAGWWVQMPRLSRKVDPKMPAAMEVTTP